MITSIRDKCSPHWQRTLLTGLAAVFLAVLLTPTTLSAQTSKGFTVEYQDSWPANLKMRYIRVVIKPVAGVSPTDHDFQVVAKHDNYQSGIIATATIPIRKGDASAVGEIYIPYHNGYNFSLHTELDGNARYNRGDFAYKNNYEYNSNGNSSNIVPTFVFASSEVVNDESSQFNVLDRRLPKVIFKNAFTGTKKFPAFDDLGKWYVKSPNYGGDRDFMTFGKVNCERAAAMSLSSLPSRWFGYEGIEVLMMTCDDLATLAKSHPGKLLAIERWVAASGRLVLLNCGDKLQRTEEALKLLGDDNQQARRNRSCRFTKAKLVTEKQIETSRDETVAELRSGGNSYLDWSQDLSKVHKRIASKKLKDALSSKKPFSMVSIDFEQGSVVCLSDRASDWSKQQSSEVDQWGEVAIFLAATRNDSPDNGLLSIDFNKAIGFPEFAEPPRYVFEFSIMAYLLLVGPIAFLVLKKFKRLNMMFVLIPAISLLVCSSILGWAIFAEGFDTRVNQFTFTRLNQETGRQTTSSLSHIYSGVTPSPYRLEGATYGVVNLPRSGRFQRFDWSQSGEEISDGEVRARTNHQLRTLCSNETDQKLEFSFQGSGDSKVATLRNGFDTEMACVIFPSETSPMSSSHEFDKSKFWVVESLAAGATAQAKLMNTIDAASLFRDHIEQRRGSASELVGYGSGYWSSVRDVSDNYRAFCNFSVRTFETLLRDGDQNAGYLAIMERATNFEPTIKNALLESEIHIIQGVR